MNAKRFLPNHVTLNGRLSENTIGKLEGVRGGFHWRVSQIMAAVTFVVTAGLSHAAFAGPGLQIATIAEPQAVPIGGQTTIGVAVLTDTGQPVPGAEVLLLMFNGSFGNTGLPIISGVTDAQGVYTVDWKTAPRSFYQGSGGTYEYLVKAAKLDHARAEATGKIRVETHRQQPETLPGVVPNDRNPIVVPRRPDGNDPQRRPIDPGFDTSDRPTPVLDALKNILDGLGTLPARPNNDATTTPSSPNEPQNDSEPMVRNNWGPMVVNVATNPTRVTGGERSTIQVTVRTQDSRPVPGASVKIGIGSGTFVSSGQRSVTGVTDANGVFSTVWQSGDASEYTTELTFGFDVEVGQPGSTQFESRTRGQVTVAPKQRRVL